MTERPDPDSADLGELDRALAGLVRQYRTASHVVAERRERPEGIDDDTFDWWICAHIAVGRRKYGISTAPVAAPAERPELRKERLRKPPR